MFASPPSALYIVSLQSGGAVPTVGAADPKEIPHLCQRSRNGVRRGQFVRCAPRQSGRPAKVRHDEANQAGIEHHARRIRAEFRTSQHRQPARLHRRENCL